MQTKMVIRCECGVEIPYVFDSAILQKNIDAHAETHWLIDSDCTKTDAANEGEAELEVARIKEKLMGQAHRMSQKIESHK